MRDRTIIYTASCCSGCPFSSFDEVDGVEKAYCRHPDRVDPYMGGASLTSSRGIDKDCPVPDDTLAIKINFMGPRMQDGVDYGHYLDRTSTPWPDIAEVADNMAGLLPSLRPKEKK